MMDNGNMVDNGNRMNNAIEDERRISRGNRLGRAFAFGVGAGAVTALVQSWLRHPLPFPFEVAVTITVAETFWITASWHYGIGYFHGR